MDPWSKYDLHIICNHTLLSSKIVKRSHTLAASTLIILFSEMLRFSKKKNSFKKFFLQKGIKTIFENILEIF